MRITDCLAKTENVSGRMGGGMDVETHCKLVGYAAFELLDQGYTSYPGIYSILGTDVKDHLSFLASLHDLGKISPGFQHKLYGSYMPLIDAVRLLGPFVDEGEWRHPAVSSIHLQSAASGSLHLKTVRILAYILDRHHGSSSSKKKMPKDIKKKAIYGECGTMWYEMRDELLVTLYNEFVGGSLTTPFDIVKDLSDTLCGVMSITTQSLFSGLLCVSDWIASSMDLASLGVTPRTAVINRVMSSGFVGHTVNKGLSFRDIYPFSPNATQESFIDLVKRGGPGKVYIMEAPMGVGKTEAALYAAYRIISNGDASGLYFGMPTIITSEKIHERVDVPFLSKCFSSSYHGAAALSHSNSALRTWGGRTLPGKSWFDSSKRRLLSNFGVGTIDQALMSSMLVRHNFVRHFGLMGKVVILDEVHSYDNYTGYILKAMVDKLITSGCTVFILSATLTTSVRDALLGMAIGSSDFPLMSCSDGTFHSISVPVSGTVSILREKTTTATSNAIEKAYKTYRSGGLVLWVENTIAESQAVYDAFICAGVDLEDIGLIHSSFTANDRSSGEGKWVGIYGKGGDRSRGRVLVGTQVLEQSIDIDADLLVTRLCPMDMLLQRMGRLYRHRENDSTRPTKGAECLILNPKKGDKGKYYGLTGYVYEEYPLLKTDRYLRTGNISLPHDIRSLMGCVYDTPPVGSMEKAAYAVQLGTVSTHELIAKQALTEVSGTDSDDRPPTRLSNIPTCSLILLKELRKIGVGSYDVCLYDGQTVKIRPGAYRSTILDIAVKLMSNTLKVSLKDTTPNFHASWAPWARGYVYMGDPGSDPLQRLVVVGSGGRIYQLDGTATTCFYLPDKGYIK